MVFVIYLLLRDRYNEGLTLVLIMEETSKTVFLDGTIRFNGGYENKSENIRGTNATRNDNFFRSSRLAIDPFGICLKFIPLYIISLC